MSYVPLPRSLKPGDSGLDVLMVKRALSRAGYRPWGLGFTQKWGAYMTKNIKQFQQDHHLKVDGEYGPDTHKLLAKYFDQYGAANMVKLTHRTISATDKIVQEALIGYNYAGDIHYSEFNRMNIVRNQLKSLLPYLHTNSLTEDCSSFVTGLYYMSPLPDPNGLSYDLQGYTGTLSIHGVRIASPQPGDLGFYGPGWPYKHVVVCVHVKSGVPMVVSHGSEGGPYYVAYNYRSDFNHWRRYV